MKMKRMISLLLAIIMVISCMSLSTLTVMAEDVADQMTLKVEREYAIVGSTVTLDILIENNPGVLGMTLFVEYDETQATLVAVENGDCLVDLNFTTPQDLSSGCVLPWDGEFVEAEHICDGVIARLTFEVADTAEADKDIAVELHYDNGAIIDNDLNALYPKLENGGIHVIDYIPGDVNMDGKINTTDVVFLRRYIAKYGEDRGARIRYAEAFELCEYGRKPTSEMEEALFGL